jgi:hypothetical protein
VVRTLIVIELFLVVLGPVALRLLDYAAGWLSESPLSITTQVGPDTFQRLQKRLLAVVGDLAVRPYPWPLLAGWVD